MTLGVAKKRMHTNSVISRASRHVVTIAVMERKELGQLLQLESLGETHAKKDQMG